MKKRAVSIHFTLKGQDVPKLCEKIKKWFDAMKEAGIIDFEEDNNDIQPTIIHHAFMPRADVEKAGYPLDVVNLFDEVAGDNQLNYYAGMENMAMSREQLLNAIKIKGGTAYFFPPIIEGVLDEYRLAESMGINTVIVTFPKETSEA